MPPLPDGTVTCMQVWPSPRYSEATINIYPNFWQKMKTDEDKLDCLTHELCHCILDELTSLVQTLVNGRFVTQHECETINEKTTQHFTTIIHALRSKIV